MFGLFASEKTKARERAAHWLELAGMVWNFRRDVMSPNQAAELSLRRDQLATLRRDRAEPAQLDSAAASLEKILRQVGGRIYPRTSLTENVDFFLVAVIVILGIRTYFVQNFEIPTNSMWPTYYGMTAETFPPGADAPGALGRIFRLAAYGAIREEIDAPASGEVSALVFPSGQLARTIVQGRSWLIFPAKLAQYTFYVGDRPVTIRLPEDFHSFDEVFQRTFFGGPEGYAAHIAAVRSAGTAERAEVSLDQARPEVYQAFKIPLGLAAAAGAPILRFDLMTGDKVFVDRFSYNFVRPKPGSGLVFFTGHIAGIGLDSFYIKRLAGVPGDELEIRAPMLYRNGRPATGSEVFDMNARRVPPYRGYFQGPDPQPASGILGLLRPGETLTVPARSYVGLGDNSADSADSRYWGFVPAKDVIGRPLCIYYPFTHRWGRAR
jgi:signal peptidase I